jgi:hypothetical protein
MARQNACGAVIKIARESDLRVRLPTPDKQFQASLTNPTCRGAPEQNSSLQPSSMARTPRAASRRDKRAPPAAADFILDAGAAVPGASSLAPCPWFRFQLTRILASVVKLIVSVFIVAALAAVCTAFVTFSAGNAMFCAAIFATLASIALALVATRLYLSAKRNREQAAIHREQAAIHRAASQVCLRIVHVVGWR